MLTNRIEHVTRAEVSTRNVKKIKCSSIEYSKTIKNKIKKNPLIIISTREFHSGDQPTEIYTKMNVMLMEFTVTDTDDQATLCRVKTTRRTKLDTAQHLSLIAKGINLLV